MNNEDNHKNSFIESPFVKWLSITIALLGFCWVCYDHVIENNPNLTFTVVKEISLLNNKANIPSIHIFLDSVDISETNSNLSIYTIRVENNGKQHITRNMYDGNIHLVLKHGEYISLPAITYVSSEHIKQHFKDSTLLADKKTLNIPCVPMDKDDIYLFDIILRHPLDTFPSFFAQGKITGQKEINVESGIKDKPSFWETTLGGGLLVNVARIIIYFILGIALLVSIILLIDKIKTTFQKIKLQKAVRQVTMTHSVNQQIINDFNKLDVTDLRLMYKWINTTDEEASKNYIRIHKKKGSKYSMRRYMYMEERQVVKTMIQKGYLTISNGKIIINKSMQNDFIFVYKQLKEQKVLDLDIVSFK